MSARGPLVSCLMPTANRRRWVPFAVAAFLKQDYADAELVVVDDGEDEIVDLLPTDPRVRYFRVPPGRSLGEKRNYACRLARGEFLAHWDDDDWSASWRLSYQISQLQAVAADVCGLSQLDFYDARHDTAWRYRYSGGRVPWLAGSTLCYRRALWERHPFPRVNVGEDSLWLASALGARVFPLTRRDFLVASIHACNTSSRQTDGVQWHRIESAPIRRRVGVDGWVLPAPSPRPLVSCLLVTCGRRPFIPLSLACFRAQDYPAKEMVIVDDSDDPIGDLVGNDPAIRYIFLGKRHSIGAKRNLACEAARGEVLIQWDDDDWFGPRRLSCQVAPLIEGRADISGLDTRWILFLTSGECWALSPSLHQRLFVHDVHGGTLAFRRELWRAGGRYPDQSLAEDAEFLRHVIARGARLVRVANAELFVYVRHEGNTWDFLKGHRLDRKEWGRTSMPPSWDSGLVSRYQSAASEGAVQRTSE